jgi:hypothetical protein
MKLTLIILLSISSCSMGSIPWFAGQKELELTGESLSADDIDIQTCGALFSGVERDWTVEGGVSFASYRESYVPVLFGTDETLTEQTLQANFGVTRAWSKEWSGTFSLSAYEGFSDYRSIWISEYYRQLFGAFPAYHAPNPGGYSVSSTSSWNYLPGSGQAKLSLFYAVDEIAPGWGFDSAAGIPVPGDDTLQTLGSSLTFDQAVNNWLKTRLMLSARNTSDRDVRLGVVNSWAATKGPVSLRITGGYSEESPTFDASHVSAILEWNFIQEWSMNIGIRAYRDSGEIQSSGFNALAPPVRSSEIFGGLAWDRGDLAVSAGIGFLESDYDPLSEDNEFFGNLYKDRDWLTLRIAASFKF